MTKNKLTIEWEKNSKNRNIVIRIGKNKFVVKSLLNKAIKAQKLCLKKN